MKASGTLLTGTPRNVSNFLHTYVQNIARALMRQGHSESEAIAIANGAVNRWRHGQLSGGEHGHIHPETRAAAGRTHAEWERLRAVHHGPAKKYEDDGYYDLSEKCLTCGCHMPDNEHDDPRHITLHDLQDAAEAAEITTREAVENIVDTTRAFPVHGNPWMSVPRP